MTSPDSPDSQKMHVHVDGAHHSAFNFGDHGSASTTNVTRTPGGDSEQRELLQAVRALREDLSRLVSTDTTQVLDTELAATEEEITHEGAAGRERLERLRASLATAGSIVTALASGVAVGQAVTTVLGG